MVLAPINLINLDERGIAYIAGTKMKVQQIILEKNAWGLTPEDIQRGHEHLTLAQIYAALSYYYEHKTEIDVEIEQTKQEVDSQRIQQPNPLNRAQFEAQRQLRKPTNRLQ